MIKIVKIIFLILLVSFSRFAVAEPSVNDLYNKEIFLQTKQQILSMKIDELDEFRDYLSSCGTNSGGEIKRFFCERSARSYILKFGQEKPVEKLIIAMAEVEFLIDMVDAADEKGQASEDMKMQVFKDLDRYIVIREMMEKAIKKAYTK
ncbi:MAG: hypothetical protein AB8D52_07990 [Gammaproteobacteria bacterium]